MSRVVFCGGKSVGYGVLQHLLETDEVVGVFTNPSDETPTWFPSVKPLIKCFYSTEKPTIKKIRALNPDWIVVAYYDLILPPEILTLAKSVNVHLGLIQEYRGCYPTTFPIIDDKDYAGVTIHEITPVVDGGRVYIQALVSVDPTDTGKTLYYKCTGAAISLFCEWWDQIRDGVLAPHEVEISAQYHNRQSFPSLEISHNLPEEQQERLLRALDFPPFPQPKIV